MIIARKSQRRRKRDIDLIRALAKLGFRTVVNSLPDSAALRLLYFRNFGRFPNLKSPKTLNEKLNWRKLYQKDIRFPIYADKVKVKDEIARLVGEQYIIPTIWSGKNSRDIPFDTLSPPYVLKVNNGNGGNHFIRVGETIERSKICYELESQLKAGHDKLYREWCYAEIEPSILAEPMIVSVDSEFPIDYKFFVYHGSVEMIQINVRKNNATYLSFYDINWRKQEIRLLGYDDFDEALPKPQHFDDMILIAEKIGSHFDFVRIDLYDTPGGPLFGEATFFPNAGIRPYIPARWDRVLGDLWRLKG